MIGQCGLDPGVNKCPYYVKNFKGCRADHTDCGFWENGNNKEKPVDYREPKWYERYYK